MYRIKYALYHSYAFRDNTLQSRQLREILSMQKSQAIFPLVHDRTFKCNKCGESATADFLDSRVEFDTRIN